MTLGMLASEEIIRVVAKALKNTSIPVVVDPVTGQTVVGKLRLGDGGYFWVDTASAKCY